MRTFIFTGWHGLPSAFLNLPVHDLFLYSYKQITKWHFICSTARIQLFTMPVNTLVWRQITVQYKRFRYSSAKISVYEVTMILPEHLISAKYLFVVTKQRNQTICSRLRRVHLCPICCRCMVGVKRSDYSYRRKDTSINRGFPPCCSTEPPAHKLHKKPLTQYVRVTVKSKGTTFRYVYRSPLSVTGNFLILVKLVAVG